MLDDSPPTLPFTFYSVCLFVLCFSDSPSEDVTDAGVWYTHTHTTQHSLGWILPLFFDMNTRGRLVHIWAWGLSFIFIFLCI